MDAYLKDRERLILEDRALRPDYSSSRSLAPQEANVDEIIRRIRAAEAESVWSLDRKSVHLHGSQQMFPGMEFLTCICSQTHEVYHAPLTDTEYSQEHHSEHQALQDSK